jgi:hypothetical protein
MYISKHSPNKEEEVLKAVHELGGGGGATGLGGGATGLDGGRVGALNG